MGLWLLYRAEPKAIQIDAHRGSSAICVRRSVLTPSYINILLFKNGGSVVLLGGVFKLRFTKYYLCIFSLES